MTTQLIPEFDIFTILMDPRAGANLRRVRLEPSHSIPVVSINNNREERSEMGYEARMMGSWTINNNQRGGHKRNCDFCVKGDKFVDNQGVKPSHEISSPRPLVQMLRLPEEFPKLD